MPRGRDDGAAGMRIGDGRECVKERDLRMDRHRPTSTVNETPERKGHDATLKDCEECKRPFGSQRMWSRFCSNLCRVKNHKRKWAYCVYCGERAGSASSVACRECYGILGEACDPPTTNSFSCVVDELESRAEPPRKLTSREDILSHIRKTRKLRERLEYAKIARRQL